jgi:deazaflavin-dependent oxidoreductase (nitroreductase family)
VLRSQIKDALGRGFNVFHRSVFVATKGRLMGNLIGMPVVLLETTGRKTGKKRQSMLTSPLQQDGKIMLVASWGGDHRHPKWFLNLRANPDVTVTMNGATRKMRGREATPQERADLWPRITSRYKDYGDYQTKTDREIPVVIIET